MLMVDGKVQPGAWRLWPLATEYRDGSASPAEVTPQINEMIGTRFTSLSGRGGTASVWLIAGTLNCGRPGGLLSNTEGLLSTQIVPVCR